MPEPEESPVFLDVLRRRNPGFVEAAIALHQARAIPAPVFLLDLDAMAANARALATESESLGLTAYAMAKQFGRNPAAISAVADAGIGAFVAVDMACAAAIHRAGERLGHLGHLVQVPEGQTDAGLACGPRHWTVFNREKAQAISDTVQRAGASPQPVLLRVHQDGDEFYSGHEGGFALSDIASAARDIERLPGATVAGVTSFPALLFDPATGGLRLTRNAQTLAEAAHALRRAGYERVEINAPGTTSVAGLRLLAEAGATQVEPGHALTGTTPLHAVRDLEEIPAMLYLTEVLHKHEDRAYCFGGGFYVDPVLGDYQVRCLLGRDAEQALGGEPAPATIPAPGAIDYYGQIEGPRAHAARVGDTAIFGFRAQAFFSRASIVPVAGIAAGTPQVLGVFTPDGNRDQRVTA
jgi:predicted amino acid racemase